MCTIYSKFYEALWQVCVQNKPKVIIHWKTEQRDAFLCIFVRWVAVTYQLIIVLSHFESLFWLSLLMNASIVFTLVWLIHSQVQRTQLQGFYVTNDSEVEAAKNIVVLWWPNYIFWVNCLFKASHFFNTPSYVLLYCTVCRLFTNVI